MRFLIQRTRGELTTTLSLAGETWIEILPKPGAPGRCCSTHNCSDLTKQMEAKKIRNRTEGTSESQAFPASRAALAPLIAVARTGDHP
jgi:hypothetical protein